MPVVSFCFSAPTEVPGGTGLHLRHGPVRGADGNRGAGRDGSAVVAVVEAVVEFFFKPLKGGLKQQQQQQKKTTKDG